MIQLKVVKTAREQATTEEDSQRDVLHGTKVLKYLLKPWYYSDRIVCADSYFASVGAVEALRDVKLRFIGVLKTATKR
jgi:Transposase IS4